MPIPLGTDGGAAGFDADWRFGAAFFLGAAFFFGAAFRFAAIFRRGAAFFLADFRAAFLRAGIGPSFDHACRPCAGARTGGRRPRATASRGERRFLDDAASPFADARGRAAVDRWAADPYGDGMTALRAPVAVALLCLAGSFLAGCGATRPKPAPLGDGEERIIGARLATAVRAENRSSGDMTVTEYVQSLGDRLARLSDRPGIPYTFEVIADP